mmetsp:Transcript_51758/g.138119  ORF Transcript_51758/g.138119 Transcript_51758/m.138119 type:complete len:239 (+) Transcript_51758:338-1054(+)
MIPHAKLMPPTPPISNNWVPISGPIMPATANVACSMPMRVPCISAGTIPVVSAVMLVLRLNWNMERNRAKPTKTTARSSNGIVANCSVKVMASNTNRRLMMSTHRFTTRLTLPPKSFTNGSSKNAFAKPPNANCADRTEPIIPSSKPHWSFRMSGCTDLDMLFAMPVNTFTPRNNPTSLKMRKALLIQEVPETFVVFVSSFSSSSSSSFVLRASMLVGSNKTKPTERSEPTVAHLAPR